MAKLTAVEFEQLLSQRVSRADNTHYAPLRDMILFYMEETRPMDNAEEHVKSITDALFAKFANPVYQWRKGDRVRWRVTSGFCTSTFNGEVTKANKHKVYVLFPNAQSPNGGRWLRHDELIPQEENSNERS